ncbi:pyrroline-5-carboxylate reductase [Candidatus Bipolaricaulota bacterium]|nr:pyrroline-5-carboxylate reductase [Candidatus Bipolaricaulota bacterium]MBS3792910.1 pyrroline-5-carboxylate reductase [Candidatus Bipolaricaulota bacterium]
MVLNDKKIGIIGVGTIGGTLVDALIKNDIVARERIIGSTSHEASAREVSEKYGIETTTDNTEIADEADIVVLAVEPQLIEKVLDGVSGSFSPDQLVISVAAGITTEFIESKIDGGIPVVRSMPNTAITVNEGATVLVAGDFASEEDLELAKLIFEPVGLVEVLSEEELMDAITGFSGSGPAYGYLIIESLIEAGVRVGLPRDRATKLAAQSLLGAAKMVLETDEHPAKLKDMVTTPAGVTVDAVMKLEEGGVRVAFFKAIEEATDKSRQLKLDGKDG